MTSSGSTVGIISDPRRRVYVEWKIPNYFSLPQKTDTFFDSPPFRFLNETWNITIYPNGQRALQTVGWVGLYLRKQHPVSSCTMTFQLGIKVHDTMIKKEPETCTFKGDGYGWRNVLRRDDLLRLMNIYPLQRILTVFCDADLSSIADAASQTKLLESTNYLCRDFQNMLKSEEKSDVTIQVHDRVFRVHKFMLEVRSPVLASAIQSDTELVTDTSQRNKQHEITSDTGKPWRLLTIASQNEKNLETLIKTSRCEQKHYTIEVANCDPDTFHEFLLYLYTGKIDNISHDNVTNLYSIADRYCIKELKEKCAEFMIENLSAETACDVLAVADIHDDEELKKSAEIVVLKNMKTLAKTDKWISLMSESPVLAGEIFMKIIRDHKVFSK